MKKALRSFLSFNRTERMGIIGLLAVIALLITIRFSMVYFVPAETIVSVNDGSVTNSVTPSRLIDNALPDSDTAQHTPKKTETFRNKIAKSSSTEVYNINMVDSQQLVGLWGIGPKLAHRILNYRRTHGKFTSHEQLLEVYRFSDTVYGILRSRLILDEEK